eukprot:scaffold63371_cov18-Tisochrysis_lutea.AAC.1
MGCAQELLAQCFLKGHLWPLCQAMGWAQDLLKGARIVWPPVKQQQETCQGPAQSYVRVRNVNRLIQMQHPISAVRESLPTAPGQPWNVAPPLCAHHSQDAAGSCSAEGLQHAANPSPTGAQGGPMNAAVGGVKNAVVDTEMQDVAMQEGVNNARCKMQD